MISGLRGPRRTLSFIEVGPQRIQRLGVGEDGEVREVGEPGLGTGQKEAWSGESAGPLGPARSFLAGLFLPKDWPDSVTPDYLEYQLWTLPTHVTGVMSHALATTSMLQAVGIDAGPGGAAGASAAIKWISKDGIGALGRFAVSARFASVFDEDPRRWRLAAEAVTTLGLALEIATQAYPGHFVLLAGGGNLATAVGHGLGHPCFRVIQARETHFAAKNNVGDVSAREEVWGVGAQLVGLGASVAMLRALESAHATPGVVLAWVGIQAAHVTLRAAALSRLAFPWPNRKRAAALVAAHICEGRVPAIREVNRGESALALPPGDVALGCTLGEALAAGAGRDLAALCATYSAEAYLLTRHSGRCWVVLRQRAGAHDALRALWQAAWLEAHPGEGEAAGLRAMQAAFPDFQRQAEAQGWVLGDSLLGQGPTRLHDAE
ncbi:hypothetical protein APUTEX25_003351 [Auxenochlorella protothecoides]|uniref:Uncharacterized protein n=1 Tax=Auxenochlorella protothecoides TaxID=3075 RepID=A0A3M7KUI9_AUXPR|nr:hypothetical protein APUTEX25_003351 [Auxenochlorella protothecoides]|eukprot:RMZ53529.1 hypothetical protein APUTEX25_003351 [Auxenochlorella protothecoides]